MAERGKQYDQLAYPIRSRRFLYRATVERDLVVGVTSRTYSLGTSLPYTAALSLRELGLWIGAGRVRHQVGVEHDRDAKESIKEGGLTIRQYRKLSRCAHRPGVWCQGASQKA